MELKNKLTYLAIFLSVLAIVFVAFTIKQKNTIDIEDTLSKIQKSGEVNVCYGIYPPQAILDNKTGELTGHDIDVVRAIFSEINVKPVFVEQTWGNLVSSLQSGRCDLVTAIFSQIPRAAAVSFSQPMYYMDQGILGKKGDERFNNLSDIDKKGIKIVVALGESGHIFAKGYFHNAEIVPISIDGPDLSRIFSEVSSGRADVAITASAVIDQYANEHQETARLLKNETFGLSAVSMAVRPQDQTLLNFVNTSLDYMEMNQQIESLHKKYEAHWLMEKKTFSVE